MGIISFEIILVVKLPPALCQSLCFNSFTSHLYTQQQQHMQMTTTLQHILRQSGKTLLDLYFVILHVGLDNFSYLNGDRSTPELSPISDAGISTGVHVILLYVFL